MTERLVLVIDRSWDSARILAEVREAIALDSDRVVVSRPLRRLPQRPTGGHRRDTLDEIEDLMAPLLDLRMFARPRRAPVAVALPERRAARPVRDVAPSRRPWLMRTAAAARGRRPLRSRPGRRATVTVDSAKETDPWTT